ncbi:hypothetical protein QEN19_001352 [Hanseniaspora menglaensis]
MSHTASKSFGNNNFLYSSDEENEDVEIFFDDSSDGEDEDNSDIDKNISDKIFEFGSKNKSNNLVKVPETSNINSYRLIELLKNDTGANNIILSHKKFKDKNEYILFPDKENFIKYQIIELNLLLEKQNNDFTKKLCQDNDFSVQEYTDRLISLLATSFWSVYEVEKKLLCLEQSKDLISTTGIWNDLIEITDLQQDSMLCPICCENILDFQAIPFIKIKNCDDINHMACKNCYSMYFKTNISDNTEIKCIGGSCNKTISYTSIKNFNKIYFENLVNFSVLQSFNDFNNTNINSCPESDCENVILSKTCTDFSNKNNLSVNIEPVSCLASHKFCLSCKKEFHSPITCNLLKKWFNKINDGNESLNWVLNNTQPCPTCDVDIEKVDGCNHMKCGFCKHEFCWICQKDWSAHGGSFYDCMNKRDIDSKKEKNIQNESFNRFRNYYKFFIESENNMLLDMRLFNKLTKRKLNNMSTVFGMSFVELEFLNDCVRELVQARNMIKYSFALLYFMDQSHNLFHIFTHNQMELLSKIDELSDLLVDINMDSTLPNSKRDTKVIQLKPYLIQSTSILQKLQLNLAKCGQDLIFKKLEIFN